MIGFKFISSSGERYGISFGWKVVDRCTIATYPLKWNGNSLALCSFTYSDRLHTEDHEDWAKEFLCEEVKEYINRLIKNKAFW